MAQRRSKIWWVIGGAIVLLTVSVLVRSSVEDRRRKAAAEAALPAARAWLATIPEYRHLVVSVGETSDTGPGVWFEGSLPTVADVARFDEQAEKCFGAGDFAVISTVLSRFEGERSAGNAADNQPLQRTGAASRPL
jgi:hypothetical protein